MKIQDVRWSSLLWKTLLVSACFYFVACGKDKPDAPPPDTTVAITSFSPAQAPPGAAVEITGRNFSTTLTNNVVKFNGVVATVTAISTDATKLTVTVPQNAT